MEAMRARQGATTISKYTTIVTGFAKRTPNGPNTLTMRTQNVVLE